MQYWQRLGGGRPLPSSRAEGVPKPLNVTEFHTPFRVNHNPEFPAKTPEMQGSNLRWSHLQANASALPAAGSTSPFNPPFSYSPDPLHPRPMFRFLTALTLILAAFLPVQAGADPADIGAAARGVVRVVLVDFDGTNARLIGHGTGFAVSDNQIVTNAHVVEMVENDPQLVIGVVPPEGKKGYMAKVVAVSRDKDLALLKLAEPGSIPALALYPGMVTDGSEVTAVGYPGNVDLAQGLGMGDLVGPQSPVKSRGAVSGGRSARSVDTILHTAAIGAGNSGGPLLDGCGRVVGVNSFGTVSNNGTDSSFFFAISMREVLPFLQRAGVKPHQNAMPCRSGAEFAAQQSQLNAGDQARLAAQAEEDRRHAEKIRRDTELQVLAERENGMAMAGVALVAALAAAGTAFVFAQRGKDRTMRIAMIASAALLIGAVVLWLVRPPLSSIDERAKDALAAPSPSASATKSAAKVADNGTGKMICVIDPQRSRVTVSDTQDIPLEFDAGGCVNTRTQYGLGANGYSRVLVPRQDETVSVNAYDPATRTFRTDHYLLGFDTMARLRDARGKFKAPECGATDEVARNLANDEQSLTALLPPEPQERLSYHCQPLK